MRTENASPTILNSKEKLRLELTRHIEAFLAAGNSINVYPAHASAYESHEREFMTRNKTRIKQHMENERVGKSDNP